MSEPARKRRRVQEPLPKPIIEKVGGTRYLTAKTIKTTRVERLPGVPGNMTNLGVKSRKKRGVPGNILRMMQIGINKTMAESLPYDFKHLSI